jgi:hypothetical protein
VPVVLMIGDPGQMKNAASGTRPYILKPFTLSDLKRVLEQAARQGSVGSRVIYEIRLITRVRMWGAKGDGATCRAPSGPT